MYDIIYFKSKQLTFLYEAKKKCLYKIDQDLNLSKVMKADSSIFPGKSLKKDILENNLFVQNSNSSIVIFTRIMQKGYKQKIEIDDVGFDQIYEFVPIGDDKIIVIGAKGEMTLIKYLGDFCSDENCRCSNNNQVDNKNPDKIKCGINCGVQELDFTNLFVANGEVFEKMEISSIAVSENMQYAAVAAHCHLTGTKKRLYLIRLKNQESMKTVEIKKYESQEKQRSAYMAMNLSYNIKGHPLLVAFEHCPKGSMISYLIQDEAFVPFWSIEQFSTGYIFTSDFFNDRIWTIDSEGQIQSLKLEEGKLVVQKKRKYSGRKSQLSSVQEVSAEQTRDSVSDRDPWRSIQKENEAMMLEDGDDDASSFVTTKNGVKIPKIPLQMGNNEINETNSDLNINHNDSFVHLEMQSFYSKESNTRHKKNINSAALDSSHAKFNVIREEEKFDTTERKIQRRIQEPDTLSKNLSQEFENPALMVTQKNPRNQKMKKYKNKEEERKIKESRRKIEFYTFDDKRYTPDEIEMIHQEIESSLVTETSKPKSSKPTAANSHETSAINHSRIPNLEESQLMRESSHNQIHESSYDTTLRNFESFSKHGQETERSKEESIQSVDQRSKLGGGAGIFDRKPPIQETFNSRNNKTESVISDNNYYFGITETSTSDNIPKSFEDKVLREIKKEDNEAAPRKIDLNYDMRGSDQDEISRRKVSGYYKRVSRPNRKAFEGVFKKKNLEKENKENYNDREESIDKSYLENNYTEDSRGNCFNVTNLREISSSMRNKELEKRIIDKNPKASDSKIKIEDLNKSGNKMAQMSQVLSKTFFSTENQIGDTMMSQFMTRNDQKQLIIQTNTHFGKFHF